MEPYTVREILERAAFLAPLESQREYRERFAAFLRMHMVRNKAMDEGVSADALPANSMMVIAQSGCGKSYTAKQLARAADVEFITVDCSTLARTGWKGCNLGDVLHAAQSECGSKSRFARAIVFFDEADKLRFCGFAETDASNPQVNFLKLYDGIAQAEPRNSSMVSIDVSRMSFVFAGAFAGLEEIVRRRVRPKRIGFRDDGEQDGREIPLLAQATMADIREYGFMEELLGRIGSLFYVPPLTTADYRMLLKGERGSVRERYANLFESEGVTVNITDSACRLIAERAEHSALGARAVEPIVREQFQQAVKRLDEDMVVNRVTLTCKNNELALSYGRGERARKPEAEVMRELKLPDISFAKYLESDEGVEEFCDLAVKAYGKPKDSRIEILSSFLRCSVEFLRADRLESDMNLDSLRKLAVSTDLAGGGESVFDRIMQSTVKKYKVPEEFREKLQDAYMEFADLYGQEDYEYLTDAVRKLRQNWYQNLLEKVG